MLMKAIAIAILAVELTISIFGQSVNNEHIYRGGIRNSSGKQRLDQKQLGLLVASLREKTGLLELGFDEVGYLTLGNRSRIAGGSATARTLLIASVDSNQAIELENHYSVPDVVFGCLAKDYIYESDLTGQRLYVRSLKLDFFDFTRLEGIKEALASFDVGMVVLHELAHGIIGLKDNLAETTGFGGCIQQINQIRRELGLPERDQYSAKVKTVRDAVFIRKIATLRFSLKTPRGNQIKTRFYYLKWDAQTVGERTSQVGH